MNRASERQEEARIVIRVACRMLERRRRVPPLFGVGAPHLGDDCYVLLEDATRSFCAGVSKRRGEHTTSRWSAIVPRLLLDHPESCDEILSVLEAGGSCEHSELAAGWA
jgi:hypothetical protein